MYNDRVITGDYSARVIRKRKIEEVARSPGGLGGLGYFWGGYAPPRTPNWHPVLKKIPPKIDTPF